jgi:CheY-like chemotaxis protein
MERASAHRHVVLVVDDYAPLQEASVLLLEAAGYTAARADSGTDALALLRGGLRPCVMFLDAYMPGMDGPDVLAAMAHDPTLDDLAVVLLSGANEVVTRARGGQPAMLAKPVEPDALFAAVDRYARCPPTTGVPVPMPAHPGPHAASRADVHARMQAITGEAANAAAASHAMAKRGAHMLEEARSAVGSARERLLHAAERATRLRGPGGSR